MSYRVALVYLERGNARGGVARVRTWRTLLDGSDVELLELPVKPTVASMFRGRSIGAAAAIARGEATPESMFWNTTRMFAHLQASRPDAVVCVTARLWSPLLLDFPLTVIDFVDHLSSSYAERSNYASNVGVRLGFRFLAGAMQRVEHSIIESPVRRVTAGWSEQEPMQSEWLPNCVSLPGDSRSAVPDHDVVFVGSLNYPPNVAAIEALAEIWPQVEADRPGTSLLIAGASPTRRVEQLCRVWNWTLQSGFGELDEVLSRASVSIAPIPFATGIQNKVLDAANRGMPQVISPAAARGVDPQFPAVIAELDEFANSLVQLLRDGYRQRQLSEAGRIAIDSRYSKDALRPVARAIVGLDS